MNIEELMQQAEIESLRHELSDERRKIGVLLKEQIDDRAEIERLRGVLISVAAECAREAVEYDESDEFPSGKATLVHRSRRAARRFRAISRQLRKAWDGNEQA